MRTRGWIGLAVLVALIGVGSWAGWDRLAGQTPDSPTTERPSSGPGPTVTVQRGDVTRSLTALGEVAPANEVTLSFAADELTELLVEEGQHVDENETVVQLDATRQRLEMLRAERAYQQAQVQSVPVEIEETRLAYELAQEAYEARSVEAPFDGVVAQVEQKRTDSGGNQYRVTLLDRSELFVELQVSETNVTRLSAGQSAEIQVDALDERRWPGEIVEVGARAVEGDRGSKVVPVRARLEETDPAILPGFSAQVRITVAEARDALRVPIGALMETGDGWAVMVVEDDSPTRQPVEIGVTSAMHAEVTSGLEAGDEVLARPNRAGPATPSSVDGPSRQP